MKIKLNEGSTIAEQIIFTTLLPVKAADYQKKMVTNQQTGEQKPKTTENGLSLYRANVEALAVKNGVPVRKENNISVALTTPIDLMPGKLYTIAGETVLTHWVNNAGRLSLSIQAETMKEIRFGEK